MCAAVIVAVALAVPSLDRDSPGRWPAFPSSNHLHALATVGQVGCLAGLVAVVRYCAGDFIVLVRWAAWSSFPLFPS